MVPKPFTIQKGCFIGEEAEGKHRGLRTLFIADNITRREQWRRVDLLISKEHIRMLYFGAAATLKFYRTAYIPCARLLEKHPSLIIKIELDTIDKIKRHTPFIEDYKDRIVVVLTVTGELNPLHTFSKQVQEVLTFISEIKLVAKNGVAVFPVDSVILTNRNDCLYKTDKEVFL